MKVTIVAQIDEERIDGLEDVLVEMGFYDIDITEEDN